MDEFDYELVLKLKKYFWTKRIVVQYNQARVIDVIRFINHLEDKKFNLNEWILDFIKKHSRKKINKKELYNIYLNSDGLFEKIKTTYFKDVFNTDKKKNIDETPISSLISFISKQGGVNGYDLLYKMNWSDLMFYCDGTMWNLNGQSKKGQRLNRLKLLQTKASKRDDKDKELIRQKLQLIKQN